MFNSLLHFSLVHSFHAISLFQAPFDLVHRFLPRLLTHPQSKTTIFLFIFQLCAFIAFNQINESRYDCKNSANCWTDILFSMALSNTGLIGLCEQIEQLWCTMGIISFYSSNCNTSKSQYVQHIGIGNKMLQQLPVYGIFAQRLCITFIFIETRYCQEVHF